MFFLFRHICFFIASLNASYFDQAKRTIKKIIIISFLKMFCHFLSLERKKVTKESSSTDDITTHPCTRLDLAFVVSFFQQLNLDA